MLVIGWHTKQCSNEELHRLWCWFAFLFKNLKKKDLIGTWEVNLGKRVSNEWDD
jgi:hypothetical protein